MKRRQLEALREVIIIKDCKFSLLPAAYHTHQADMRKEIERKGGRGGEMM